MSKNRLTDEQIIEQMHAYIDLAFSMCDFDSLGEIAKATGLCTSTVTKLLTHTTRFPRYLTLKKFGDACGLHLVWTKQGQPKLKLA